MEILTLLGEQIFICADRGEANKCYFEDQTRTGRIWMSQEIIKAATLDTAQVQELIRRKREKPGYVWKGEEL